MGIFKHVFWVAPVAILVLWLTMGQNRETGAKVDVKEREIHGNVMAIMSEALDDPKLKQRSKEQMKEADKETKDAKALLKEREAENNQTAAEMNKQMQEVDRQLKGVK